MIKPELSRILVDELLEQVMRPGQYLGNEWGALRKPFESANVRLALTFPDVYELGLSNFGLKILYKVVNCFDRFMCDRSYAPAKDMEAALRERGLPLWAWESRRPLADFELLGFSLQYELTYTNVLNLLDLSGIPVFAEERREIFPLIFGGGPSSVNPEPMADFMDFYIIGDGEESVPRVMEIVDRFKTALASLGYRSSRADEGRTELSELPAEAVVPLRRRLLTLLSRSVPGVYVPALYELAEGAGAAAPMAAEALSEYLGELPSALASTGVLPELLQVSPAFDIEAGGPKRSSAGIPERVFRQVAPLDDGNQPTGGIVPYLSLVHDREVLEVRRGCDRGCRFCQPGYTFLPVRERSTDDLLRLSKEALQTSGHEEYSLLSLCVSDYTSLHETVRALNREHSAQRSSLSFPSQRADRMNLDLAEELKAVRKSGITLAPEAGTERMRAVVNKGLNHDQIISAIDSAYIGGWNSVKLYFMCCLPTERDEDLKGIIDILKEATERCRQIRRSDPERYRRAIEFTCTISNFVPKPFTPFQWFGQVNRAETARKHQVLRAELKGSGLRNVTLNVTDPEISLLEAVISRGDRSMSRLIHKSWLAGATFDAWDDQFRPELWHRSAEELGTTLEALACTDREVGSTQPWDVVHIGLNNWWLVKEWEKAMSVEETAPCTENTCHACGVCTELDTNHELASPKVEVMKKNPFVKELAAHDDEDSHPSLFFQEAPEAPPVETVQTLRFIFTKRGDLRFISHLDTQTLLIRAARRAGLTMAYTQGFNPSPKLALASPLPLFMESAGEVAELELARKTDAEAFLSKMNAQLPEEFRIVSVLDLPERPVVSLAQALATARYSATLVLPEWQGADGAVCGDARKGKLVEALSGAIRSRIEELLSASAVMVPVPKSRKRKGKKRARSVERPSERDIRDGIKSLLLSSADNPTIEMELSTSSSLHVKPQEVLECISSSPELVEIIESFRASESSGSSEPGDSIRAEKPDPVDPEGSLSPEKFDRSPDGSSLPASKRPSSLRWRTTRLELLADSGSLLLNYDLPAGVARDILVSSVS